MLYKRLVAEMFVKEITKDDLATLLGKSKRSIENKINGKTILTTSEAITIKNTYFKEYSMNYIFSTDESVYKMGISA